MFRTVILRALALLLLATWSAQAVILYRTGDPTANTTEPAGPGYAESGWQYQGTWGGFLGTPIAPHFFISAAHIGAAGGSSFTFDGVTYQVISQFSDPQSDLALWKVAEEFPLFAPLYSRTDEVGQRLIAIGRGTPRGAPVTLNDILKGWAWAIGDGVMRWGENIVSSIVAVNPSFELLRSEFDMVGLPNECHLSVGDSGGAAFINDAGMWKLAGIHYAVDGPFYTDAAGAGTFFAALFDRSGFFEQDGAAYVAASGPSALYPTRISTKLPWIGATIAQPLFGDEPNYLTLTYTKLIIPPSDLSYLVEESTDLVSWEPSAVTEEILSVKGSTQVVKAKVTIGERTALFIRLRVQRP